MTFAPTGRGMTELDCCVGNGTAGGVGGCVATDDEGVGNATTDATDEALDAAAAVAEITICPLKSGDVCDM